MDQSSPSPRCPGCGRPLAPGRALGLCPRCLLARAALATESEQPAAAPTVPDLTAVAAAFPQLEILELIGRGGMGVVYRARQKSLNRMVALKLLAPGREQDPAFAERFAKEARALAALNHPNIVTVHDFGFAPAPAGAAGEGFYFLLMEFVDGVNLRQAMQAGRFTPEQALAIVPPVCGALQFAHERGIVHRDIKPENLLLDKDGRIKIADFGIAKMLGTGGAGLPLGPAEASPRAAEGEPAGTPAPSAFTVHTAAGTPHYMAPEQRDPTGGADHRADIYSLGVVLYELLTGELPGARLKPPSHKVQIDVRLDEIVLRALSVRPELRYATAAEFRTQLDTVASGSAVSSGAVPDAGSVARLLKSSGGLLYRPEELDTVEGQFCVWKRRGQLLLDEQRLTFVRNDQQTVIPLAAIRDVSLGEFPRSMNPAGVDLFSVTYDESGQSRRLLLAPMDGWFAWPGTWNARVADWHAALRNAVALAIGKEPAETPRSQVAVPKGHGGMQAFMMVAYAVPMLTVFLMLTLARGNPGSGNPALAALFVVAMLGGGYFGQRLVWRFLRRADPSAASAVSPWSRVLGTLLLLGGLMLGWGLVGSRTARAQAETQGTLVKLQVAKAQEADFQALLSEFEAEAADPRDETQRSADQIKRSRLQRELDAAGQRSLELERILARGVPRVDRASVLLTVLPLVAAGFWLLLRPGSVALSDTRPRRWMQWLGGGLLAFGLPLGGLGAWMAYQVVHDPSWNPAPAEAFVSFAVWLGSAVLVVGGLALLAFARPRAVTAEIRQAEAIKSLGVGLLVLGCVFPLVAVVYVTTTPPAFRATLRFRADDTAAWLIIPEFWRRSFGQDHALSLQAYRDTRLFELHGDDATPEGSVRRVNDAFAVLQADKLGGGLEVIDRPVLPGRAIRPNRPLALAVGIAGFLFLALPGIWLIRRGLFVLLLMLIPVAVLGGVALVSYLSLQQPAPPTPVELRR